MDSEIFLNAAKVTYAAQPDANAALSDAAAAAMCSEIEAIAVIADI